jgi:3-hydroxybutyryl-CoA dehydrogenase
MQLSFLQQNELIARRKDGEPCTLGPLALANLIRLDVLLSVMQILHDEFADSKYRPCPVC